TCVTSPIDGVIAKKVGNLGEVVKPGQPIAIVVDLANLWVEANLEETKIEQVRWGQAVDLAVDAYPGKKFKGKVVNIGAAASSEFALIPENRSAGNFTKVTQRIPVKIEVIEPVRQLRPGMMVEVAIKTNSGKIGSDNEAVAQVPDHAK
ncbi:MAG: efflux RND transporter periplasmic adaptor subunit, partial [Desulfoferrobacter sp.]